MAKNPTSAPVDLEWSVPELRSRLTPLLKWPGGKRELVKGLLPFLPSRFKRYFEPFFGGGALYFAIRPHSAVLSDNNIELINCYLQVRDAPNAVVEHLRGMRNTERDYYLIRATVPADPVERAARLIYLTTLSFNGIYRENLKGDFNVPYGRKTHVQPCDESKIGAISESLRGANLLCADFADSLSSAGPSDLVYLDPPYTVAHGNNGFVKYNASIFSWGDQTRLAQVAQELVERGCHVVVSNADHPSIREIYPGFACSTVHRPSRISASPQHRRRVTESVLYSGGNRAE